MAICSDACYACEKSGSTFHDKHHSIFLMIGSRPSLKYISVFGCAAFVLRQPAGSKFDAKAREGVLIEVLEHGVYKILIQEEERGMYSIV